MATLLLLAAGFSTPKLPHIGEDPFPHLVRHTSEEGEMICGKWVFRTLIFQPPDRQLLCTFPRVFFDFLTLSFFHVMLKALCLQT